MTVEAAFFEDLEIAPDATTPRKGKRRFLFMRNAKALTGLVILGFFFLIAIIGRGSRRTTRTSGRRPSCSHRRGST